MLFRSIFPKRQSSLTPVNFIFLCLPATLLVFYLPVEEIRARITIDPWDMKPVFWNIYPVLTAYLVFVIVWGLAVLLVKYFGLKDVDRMQIRYLFWGAALSVIMAVISGLILPFFDVLMFARITPVFSMVLVGFTFYSIVKYRLINIEAVIKRSVVFVATSVFICALLALIAMVLQELLHEVVTYRTFAITVFSSFFVALLIQPAYSIARDLLDEKFFKKAFVSQQKLLKSGQYIMSSIRFDQLINLLCETVDETMDVTSLSVLLLDRNGKKYKSVNSETVKQYCESYAQEEIAENLHICAWLSSNKQIFIKSEIEKDIKYGRQNAAEGELILE